MKNELKNSKGITLIALALTIIVMMIIAAVAIGLSINSNGIFNRTYEAKNKVEEVAEFDKAQVDEFKASMNYAENSVTLTFNYNGAYNHAESEPVTYSNFSGELNDGFWYTRIYMDNLSVGDTIIVEYDYECTNLTADTSNSYRIVLQNSGAVNSWHHEIGRRNSIGALGTIPLTHFVAWTRTLSQEDIDEGSYRCNMRADYYTGGSITVSNLTVRKINETTQQKQSGERIGSLPTLTPEEGYTFAGWYTQPTGGIKITEDSRVPTTNTTYYAHWSK